MGKNILQEIRRSSLITPYGIGSIVPMSDEEFYLVAGLDEWHYGKTYHDYEIKEERLCRRLGVQSLRMPPDSENAYATIPGIRFPNNFYCPKCGTVKELQPFQPIPSCRCSSKPIKMIPDRFIVVCPEGHLDDFPIGLWIHKKSNLVWDKERCKIKRSYGSTGGLASDITYRCSCGAVGHMAEAMGKGALKKAGIKCYGKRPWLGYNSEDCSADPDELRVTLRGSTNVWFPITRSSIYIPTQVTNLIPDNTFELIKCAYTSAGATADSILAVLLSKTAADLNVDVEKLVIEFRARFLQESDNDSQPDDKEEISEDQYRQFEYENLIRTSGSDSEEFNSKAIPSSVYSSIIQNSFDIITIVSKLRETRALVGFSRLIPQEDNKISEAKKMLYVEDQRWLPAVTVYGEGLFMNFNKEALSQWAKQDCVLKRIAIMNKAFHKNSLWKDAGDLRPEFVMIHTFAHIMINQLSFECGYGTSSLRERIYCEKTDNKYMMNGVLIYTASGDSEGTLGGLAAQGKKGILDDVVTAAIENARWCSSDPICIESQGQGTDSCNLAACHNCALLPETSCELSNRLLDRALLIGTPENPELGFFNYISI